MAPIAQVSANKARLDIFPLVRAGKNHDELKKVSEVCPDLVKSQADLAGGSIEELMVSLVR